MQPRMNLTKRAGVMYMNQAVVTVVEFPSRLPRVAINKASSQRLVGLWLIGPWCNQCSANIRTYRVMLDLGGL